MKQAAPISLLVTLLFLSPAIITVLPASASTLMYQSVVITVDGPTTAVVEQATTLAVHVTENGAPAKYATVYFYLDGQQVVNRQSGSTIGAVKTDSFGNAYITDFYFGTAGTKTFTASVATSSGATATKSWTCTVTGGGATPVPATPVPATPVPTAATPQPTVPKPTVATPTEKPAAQPTIIINVPPPTVITQVIPGTATQSTGPWGDPRVTVQNQGPDKLRTTILDFAKNPEDNTAHYNEKVKAAGADGWTLAARGEKTYGDSSKDYRYSRFTKGSSTLLLAAQGNNSTEKNYDIPGDVLISETEETFAASASGLGTLLPGFEAVYAVAGLVAVAYLVMRRLK